MTLINVLNRLLLVTAAMIMAPLQAASLPGPLVDADWLLDNIDEVVVLDVRKDLVSFSRDGHIESAVLVDSSKVRTTREINGKTLTRMIPAQQDYIESMQDHGVSTDSLVVITHKGETAGNVASAARLYWQMKYYGFDNVALLDGGNRAWTEALGDLVTEVLAVTPGKLQVSETRPELLASMDDVKQAMQDENTVLVDTRRLRFHIGMEKRDYVYAHGHIPGSRLMPFTFLHPLKGAAVFLSDEEIRNAWNSLRIEDDKQVILYCNSAYENSSLWFVLAELQGRDNVKVYDGGLHEWTQYKDAPMTTITSFAGD